MASNIRISLRINLPQCVDSAAEFGGVATIWRACPPRTQRGTAADLL